MRARSALLSSLSLPCPLMHRPTHPSTSRTEWKQLETLTRSQVEVGALLLNQNEPLSFIITISGILLRQPKGD
jgi:hypothetical protein